jgi:hypothetical protein
MTVKTYSLYDGKYTIIYKDQSGPQIQEILRNNTSWKTIDDVAGDSVLRLLFDRVLELEEQLLNIELDKDK